MHTTQQRLARNMEMYAWRGHNTYIRTISTGLRSNHSSKIGNGIISDTLLHSTTQVLYTYTHEGIRPCDAKRKKMGSSGQLFRGVLALISIVYVATYIRLVLTPSIKDYMNFVKIGVLLNTYHHVNIPTKNRLWVRHTAFLRYYIGLSCQPIRGFRDRLHVRKLPFLCT